MSGDYDKKYPPDRPGEEAGADARVWRVYRDRASDVDEDIIGGWNKTLDVLLIFAGLFSAVATALLVEAQKQLEPDQAKYLTAAFLAVHLNQSISDDRFNPATYAPSLQARWVAALWLVSLVIALVVALLAILAKQWLGEYSSQMRAPAASHRHWATRHIALHRGLHRWKLDAFIGALPVGLHVSLFLFFSGLIVFFWTLNFFLTVVIFGLTILSLIFYFAAFFSPLVWDDCPTQTPLLRQAAALVRLSLRRTSNRKLRRLDPKDFTLIREQQLHEQALAWMMTFLPATEDLHVAIRAIGCLDSAQKTPGSYLPSSLCKERVADILSRCTADLLDAQSQATHQETSRSLMTAHAAHERSERQRYPPCYGAGIHCARSPTGGLGPGMRGDEHRSATLVCTSPTCLELPAHTSLDHAADALAAVPQMCS